MRAPRVTAGRVARFRRTSHPGPRVAAGALASVLTLGASVIGPGLADPAAAQDRRPATIEDVLAFRDVGSVAMSPDGRWVAYVVTVRDLDKNDYDADVWVVPAEGGEPLQLTRGGGFDGSPAWSPDGSWLAFRSDRGEETQVYGIDPRGGEAWPVTDSETSVAGFTIAPDGAHLAWTATEPESDADKELAERRGRPIVADSAYAHQWTRLWVAPLNDRTAGEASILSPEGHQVTEAVWSPDGREVAWSARPAPDLRTLLDARVYAAEASGDGFRQVADLDGEESPVEWTETHGLLLEGSGDRIGTDNFRVWRVDPAGDSDPVSLTDGWDEDAELVWAGDGHLLVESSFGVRRGLARLALSDGEGEAVYDGPLFAAGFSPSDDGSVVAFVAQSPTAPPELFTMSTDGAAPRRLTDLNPQASDIAWGETRAVQWRSRADGETIEGVLTLPVGYREGQGVPLLLRIHGGPSGVSTLSFHGDDGAYPTQVFAGLGYAVLQPNYRGSTGYGERFRGLNRGDISGRDWVDVDSGVDHLIEQGVADPDRLGVMGWSFGGHHTYWGITQTDRYRAASAGAGANELISMYHQTDLPWFYNTYLGPDPWQDWDLYEERSAYRRVDRVTTPLLIQVGENDERVPKEQSRMFYEAMRELGRAPVIMVTYPGQPHGVRDPALMRDLMTRNVEWFSRWIPVDGNVTNGTER